MKTPDINGPALAIVRAAACIDMTREMFNNAYEPNWHLAYGIAERIYDDTHPDLYLDVSGKKGRTDGKRKTKTYKVRNRDGDAFEFDVRLDNIFLLYRGRKASK